VPLFFYNNIVLTGRIEKTAGLAPLIAKAEAFSRTKQHQGSITVCLDQLGEARCTVDEILSEHGFGLAVPLVGMEGTLVPSSGSPSSFHIERAPDDGNSSPTSSTWQKTYHWR
jgi:hypothetical protein